MEAAQAGVLGVAAVRVVGGRVVADTDQLHALQPQHAPRFRPAPVVADQHAGDRPVPLRPGAEGGKAEVAIGKIPLFQLLIACAGARLHRAWQVHLAVAAQHRAVRLHQDGAVEALPGRGAFGIADIEAHPQRPRPVKQRLHRRVRHCRFVIGGEFVLRQQPAREEGGERELGEHHQAGALPRRLLQQGDHAGQGLLARVGPLRRAHLCGGDT